MIRTLIDLARGLLGLRRQPVTMPTPDPTPVGKALFDGPVPDALARYCTTCGALPGRACIERDTKRTGRPDRTREPHKARTRSAGTLTAEAHAAALAAMLKCKEQQQ